MSLSLHTVFAALGLLGVSLATGCAGGANPLAGPEPQIAAYRAGDYEAAYKQAVARYESSQPPAKDRAALIAGMAAYALRRPEQGEQWLNPLTGNPDKEVAGRANWTLAMIAYDRGNFVRSATQAASAASLLEGDEAARARLIAGDAASRLGKRDEAVQHWQVGKSGASDGALRATLESRLVLARAGSPPPGATPPPGPGPSPPPSTATGGPFVIQLGAFASRAAAEQKVTEASPLALRAGLPVPRVVPTADRTGKALSAVRLGGFPDRSTAESALRRLGVQGTVMRAGL